MVLTEISIYTETLQKKGKSGEEFLEEEPGDDKELDKDFDEEEELADEEDEDEEKEETY